VRLSVGIRATRQLTEQAGGFRVLLGSHRRWIPGRRAARWAAMAVSEERPASGRSGASWPPAWLDRSVFGLTATQFLGAFNDNLFKTLILLLYVQLDGSDQQAIAFAVFALPFVLFSGIAGELSERFSKSRTIVWMKLAEVGVMAAAVVAFRYGAPWHLLVVLFVMGAQSTFFGPRSTRSCPS
jgi:hypothetical protein